MWCRHQPLFDIFYIKGNFLRLFKPFCLALPSEEKSPRFVGAAKSWILRFASWTTFISANR